MQADLSSLLHSRIMEMVEESLESVLDAPGIMYFRWSLVVRSADSIVYNASGFEWSRRRAKRALYWARRAALGRVS